MKVLARTFVVVNFLAGNNGVTDSNLTYFDDAKFFAGKISWSGDAIAFGFDGAVSSFFIR